MGAMGVWWVKNGDFRDIPIPEDIDMFAAITDPSMKEYYRMKGKLQERRDK